MNPKEKADFLFQKHLSISKGVWKISKEIAKEHAILSVDEILNNSFLEPQLKRHIGSVEPSPIHLEYWFEVKKEIKRI